MQATQDPWAALRKALGRRLREARTLRDWTQGRVAAKAGWSVWTWSRLERGEQSVPAEAVPALATILGVAPLWLLGTEEAARAKPLEALTEDQAAAVQVARYVLSQAGLTQLVVGSAGNVVPFQAAEPLTDAEKRLLGFHRACDPRRQARLEEYAQDWALVSGQEVRVGQSVTE